MVQPLARNAARFTGPVSRLVFDMDGWFWLLRGCPVPGDGQSFRTFPHLSQDNSAPDRTFFYRTNLLAARLGCDIQELPVKIGVSRRTLFECRSADSAVTGKTWGKLEAAERLAGLTSGSDKSAPADGGSAKSEGNPKEIPVPGGNRAPDYTAVLTRIAVALEELVAGMSKEAAGQAGKNPDNPPP